MIRFPLKICIASSTIMKVMTLIPSKKPTKCFLIKMASSISTFLINSINTLTYHKSKATVPLCQPSNKQQETKFKINKPSPSISLEKLLKCKSIDSFIECLIYRHFSWTFTLNWSPSLTYLFLAISCLLFKWFFYRERKIFSCNPYTPILVSTFLHNAR